MASIKVILPHDRDYHTCSLFREGPLCKGSISMARDNGFILLIVFAQHLVFDCVPLVSGGLLSVAVVQLVRY